jgi:DNA transformation protein
MSRQYADHICDLLSPLGGAMGEVVAKGMFGGFGIYLDGLMFALIADDVLYFRCDDGNREAYEEAGMEPFRPFADRPKAKPVTLPYWEAPAELFDEPDDLCVWARAAYDAALRCRKPKKTKKAKKN